MRRALSFCSVTVKSHFIMAQPRAAHSQISMLTKQATGLARVGTSPHANATGIVILICSTLSLDLSALRAQRALRPVAQIDRDSKQESRTKYRKCYTNNNKACLLPLSFTHTLSPPPPLYPSRSTSLVFSVLQTALNSYIKYENFSHKDFV